VLANREKLAHFAHHYTWRVKRRVRRVQVAACIRFERPLPEGVRDDIFLHINGQADRRYVEQHYPGEIVMFYGEDLYDDPSIGWSEFAANVVCHAVPGEHPLGNRESMAEPKVGFVAEQLQAYLEAAREQRTTEAERIREPVLD
jgi:hypothetical protein